MNVLLVVAQPVPELFYRRRHIAIAGKRGHVASFDWLTGKMHCELELRETCRDITYVGTFRFVALA